MKASLLYPSSPLKSVPTLTTGKTMIVILFDRFLGTAFSAGQRRGGRKRNRKRVGNHAPRRFHVQDRRDRERPSERHTLWKSQVSRIRFENKTPDFCFIMFFFLIPSSARPSITGVFPNRTPDSDRNLSLPLSAVETPRETVNLRDRETQVKISSTLDSGLRTFKCIRWQHVQVHSVQCYTLELTKRLATQCIHA